MDGLLPGVSDSLKETVDAGLDLLGRRITAGHETFTAWAIKDTWRELLEAADAVDILVRAGAVGPSRIIGRTVLELAATIQYLVDRNDERVGAVRSLAMRMEFERQVMKAFSDVPTIPEEIHAELDRIHKETVNAQYSSWAQMKASEELKELPAGAPWYAVFDGPSGPAARLRQAGLDKAYEKFFVPWNWAVHGTTADSHSTSAEPKFHYRPLRHYGRDTADKVLFVVGGAMRFGMVTADRYFFPRRSEELAESMLDSYFEGLDSCPGDFSAAWDGE